MWTGWKRSLPSHQQRFISRRCDLSATHPLSYSSAWRRLFACVVFWNDLSFSTRRFTLGSTWWPWIWFPEILQKSIRASMSFACWSNGWDPSDSPWRTSLYSSSRAGCSWIQTDFRNRSLNLVPFSFALSLRAKKNWRVLILQLSNIRNQDIFFHDTSQTTQILWRCLEDPFLTT